MLFDHWIAFAAAAIALCLVPGPTVLLVVSYTLGHGRKPAAALVAGVALGDLTAMTASMIGLGALIAASTAIFVALKWIGAAYLMYLGIKLWRSPAAEIGAETRPTDARPMKMLAHAYAVTALNPKSLIFFVAFVPAFLTPGKPLAPQMALLDVTFVTIGALNASAYALLAAYARRHLRHPRVQRAVNRTGGSFLIVAGLMALGWRKGIG